MEINSKTLVNQIEKIKKEIAALGDIRPGSLSMQYNVCGSPGCRCKAKPPVKHGPYHQVSFTRKGKGRSRFVKAENLPAVKKELKNYARLRDLVDQWIELASTLADLRAKNPAD